jgi:hypothetical protein
MELMIIVSGIVVLALAYALWVWWKDGRSLEPSCERIRHRLRSALGVISRDEMRVMQEHLQHLKQQSETRLTSLEGSVKFSTQLQYVSKEIDRRLTQLEMSEGAKKNSETACFQRPRSIVHFGLRWTISDALWAYLGISSVEDIEDSLIDSVLQGPFCPVCLKRWVGRDRSKNSREVPAQCRHCGVSWDRQGTVDLPISLVELKRKVYDKLDEEYRADGTIRPYDY